MIRERMLIELLRYKNKLPFDYYKEIIGNYRSLIYELDIERIQDYAATFPKSKMISEALEMRGVLMATIREMIRQANADGYVDDNAEAKVCQDVVLKAFSKVRSVEMSLSRVE